MADNLVGNPRLAHPDSLNVGIFDNACPRCEATLIDGVVKATNAPIHMCPSDSCGFWINCPRHGETSGCILPWSTSHERLGPCLRGHRGTWIWRSRKGRSNSLICYGAASSQARGFCGLTAKWWIGKKPCIPAQNSPGVNPYDRTKFLILRELSDGPLVASALITGTGLTDWAVRACLRRLSNKKVALAEVAGRAYSPSADRVVLGWQLTPYGKAWLNFHQMEGSFDD